MKGLEIASIALPMLVLDSLWIYGFLLGPFAEMIEKVQGQPMQVRMSGAIVAYLALLILAIVFIPKTDNYVEAFLLGFCVYAVYDATNFATLKYWDVSVAVADSLWGGVLFMILRYFSRIALMYNY